MQENTDISTQILEQNKLLLELICEMQIQIQDLQTKINPIHKFFVEPKKSPVRKITKKEREDLAFEEHQELLKRQSLARIKANS